MCCNARDWFYIGLNLHFHNSCKHALMSSHADISSDTAFDMISSAYKVFMEIDQGKRLFARP
jgi:hypothetical protein